jgi:hypothetical protein
MTMRLITVEKQQEEETMKGYKQECFWEALKEQENIT